MDNIKLKQLGAILLLGGLILLGFTLHSAHRKGRILDESRLLEARVVERFTAPTRNAAEPELVLRIEMVVDGTPHRIERTVEESYWQEHAEGDAVQVALHGKRWREARLLGATNDRLIMWIKVGGGALAALLGLIVLAYDRWRV